MRRLVHRDGRVAVPLFYGALLIFACLAAVNLTACRKSAGPNQDVSVHLKIVPQPVRRGNATVMIQLADRSGMPISHAQIKVEGDMSHPGMAPVFGEANETTPGNYQTHLDFNMPGDWVVLLHVHLENGRKIERQIDVRGVESN
jgi:hypothetical protein